MNVTPARPSPGSGDTPADQRPRIAICGVHIESSTFTPHVASAADFEVTRGDALLARYAFLQPGQRLAEAADWLPVLHARALPGGPLRAEDYHAWKAEIVAGLRALGPVDGVFLDIHGAMSVVGMNDAEGDLVAAVRAAVGPDAVLSASMDLHGNVSELLFETVELLTCYRTAPHVDVWESRERAVTNLLSLLRAQPAAGGRPPLHRALVHVPILLPGEKTSTRVEPAASLYARIDDLVARDGVTDVSLWIGFAWADEPRCKAAVVAHGSSAQAVQQAALDLGTAMWRVRHDFDFVGPTLALPEAVDEAISSPLRPFMISDSGDNPGAGGADDTTAALAELLSRPEIVEGRVTALVASILDPGAVASAERAGVGATVRLSIGGHLDTRAPGPLDVEARVQHLSTCRLGGRVATVRVSGVDVVLTSNRSQYATAAMFRDAGVPLGSHDIVVVKMGYLEPDLHEAQRGWVIALTPGGVDQDLVRLGHRHIDRPMIPFDDDVPAPVLTMTA